MRLRTSMTTRQGRKVPRVLYQQLGDEPDDGDPVIGLVDTPELAALIVGAVNARAVPRQQQVVLQLRWTEDGRERQEVFGPWSALEDGDVSHLEAVHGFLGDWCRLSGREPDDAMLILLIDPDERAREREREQGGDDI